MKSGKFKTKLTVRSILGGLAILALLSMNTGCSKSNNPGNNNPGGGDTLTAPADDSYYYKATIGGTAYLQTVNTTNGYIAGSSVNGSDDVTLAADIGTDVDPRPANSTAMSITKGILHHYFSITIAQYNAFLATGTYHFTTGPSYSPFSDSDGFTIQWMDSQGKYWNTYSGTGDQTGSTIKILSIADAKAIVDYYVDVKIQFTCKLYSEDTGEMKQVTNGEFFGVFGKF